MEGIVIVVVVAIEALIVSIEIILRAKDEFR